jgi:hypothetical protein
MGDYNRRGEKREKTLTTDKASSIVRAVTANIQPKGEIMKYSWQSISNAQAAQLCRHAEKRQPYRGYAVEISGGRLVSNTPNGWMLASPISHPVTMELHAEFDGVIDGMDNYGSVQS